MEKKEQASITENASEDRAPSGSRKLQGVSIMASVLLPMVAAYIVFYTGMGIPSETINQGKLLQPPVKINELKINYQGWKKQPC